MEIKQWKSRMIEFGCDGTNANIAAGGLRDHLTHEMPWIFVFWCLAHRLELAIKDALKSTYFSTIDDLLLHLYFLYENLPKKCRELEDIVAEVKECFHISDVPKQGGTRPLRTCGTHFVTHTVAALERVIERYGDYLSHLISMTEDPSIKSPDKQKMKGYILKWQDSQVLLSCAFFHDLLKSPSILCKVLQEDEICVVRAIQSVYNMKKSLAKLKTRPLEELPTVKKVIVRITDVDGSVTYQGVELKKHDRALTHRRTHSVEWIEGTESCLRNRIKYQDTELLNHTLTILATKGWQRTESIPFGHAALDAISTRFQTPLESASVDCFAVKDEWDSMVEFGRNFLNLVQEDYKIIWWKLFNSVDAQKWSHVLSVVELLFCLPMANGQVERVFSQLKLIKINRQTCLGEDTLDRLLRINVEGPALSQWDTSAALQLRQYAKMRRVNRQDPSPASEPSTSASSQRTIQEEPSDAFCLDDWEQWIAD